MQIELIETYLDLIETRSFNRTADRMGVTQSTVSARVKALEKVIERDLFTRSRAGTQLTTAGLKFEQHARMLRHNWREALRATRAADNAAISMRVGLQTDLADSHIGDWVQDFRNVLPETAFYLELDYSIQMCAELIAGEMDLAVIYTPRPNPDLYFESVGEVIYRCVSTESELREKLRPERFISASYSPAFDHALRRALPGFSDATLASGQSQALAGLLTTLGGAAYVLEETADALVAGGHCVKVKGVPPIAQTVYTAVHIRHRHSHVHRRLLGIVRRYFSGEAPRPRN